MNVNSRKIYLYSNLHNICPIELMDPKNRSLRTSERSEDVKFTMPGYFGKPP